MLYYSVEYCYRGLDLHFANGWRVTQVCRLDFESHCVLNRGTYYDDVAYGVPNKVTLLYGMEVMRVHSYVYIKLIGKS